MRVERLVFMEEADGLAPLELQPTSVTIFIGPNNGGKSTALREIHAAMFSEFAMHKVVAKAPLAPLDDQEARAKLQAVLLDPNPSQPDNRGIGRRGSSTAVHRTTLDSMFQAPLSNDSRQLIRQIVLPHFALNLSGDARLSLASQGGAQKLADKPMSTIAAVFKDDSLRAKISKVIHDAFGQYLVIDPTEMGVFSYALATRPLPLELERSFTNEAIAFFKETEPLALASDGTRAFVGVVTEVLAGDADVIFIDEPEAFLHPGLAYALGREVALNVSSGKQLFAATHSPQFLMGCLSAGTDINIVRLSRREGRLDTNLLDSKMLSSMMSEPLLRSSNVIAGLFYNSAVVVEGDSDRSFYEEVNLRLNHVGKGIKHPIFINAHGKQTAADISRALRHAGVPTALLLDLDWLKEDGSVRSKYFDGAGLPATSRSTATAARQQSRKDLEMTGKNFKRDGGIDLLIGDAKVSADDFLDHMAHYGLFTVRRGEVEAWLSDLQIARGKTGWLERIFTAMGNDRAAHSYVHAGEGDVWSFIQCVSEWLSNTKRKGMPASNVH